MPTPSAEGLLLPGGGIRRVFFAGKGGVGKTTLAVAAALTAARAGYRTLLVTTDPAAHIGNVLACPVGDEPAPVPGVPGLFAARIARRSATRHPSWRTPAPVTHPRPWRGSARS
jgi:arsenite-transporting ATPase